MRLALSAIALLARMMVETEEMEEFSNCIFSVAERRVEKLSLARTDMLEELMNYSTDWELLMMLMLW